MTLDKREENHLIFTNHPQGNINVCFVTSSDVFLCPTDNPIPNDIQFKLIIIINNNNNN